jgi:CheY-like chemotaxis protein
MALILNRGTGLGLAISKKLTEMMGGYEATEKIRNLNNGRKDVPIVAMTANAMKGDREKCLEAGMNDYVTKPVKPQNLLDAITKWIN